MHSQAIKHAVQCLLVGSCAQTDAMLTDMLIPESVGLHSSSMPCRSILAPIVWEGTLVTGSRCRLSIMGTDPQLNAIRHSKRG